MASREPGMAKDLQQHILRIHGRQYTILGVILCGMRHDSPDDVHSLIQDALCNAFSTPLLFLDDTSNYLQE